MMRSCTEAWHPAHQRKARSSHAMLRSRFISGNELTHKGIGDVVQFARTQGSDATLIDLSDNRLDDEAASELARLVKNYSSIATHSFIHQLLLSGNNLGKNGATKLIQYAHWERDRYKNEREPPQFLKLDLSDNCIERPADLIDDLKSKRIKCTSRQDDECTVYLPDFMDQRDPMPDPPPRSSGPSRTFNRYDSGECFDFQKGRCGRGSACRFSHGGRGGGGGGGGSRGRDYDRRDDYDRRERRRDYSDDDDDRDRRYRRDDRDRRRRDDSDERDRRRRDDSDERDRRRRDDSDERDRRRRDDSDERDRGRDRRKRDDSDERDRDRDRRRRDDSEDRDRRRDRRRDVSDSDDD